MIGLKISTEYTERLFGNLYTEKDFDYSKEEDTQLMGFAINNKAFIINSMEITSSLIEFMAIAIILRGIKVAIFYK